MTWIFLLSGISIDFVQIHARLGELLYVCSSSPDGDASRLAGKSVQHFCRSIELCDDYLRGFYGLVLVRDNLLCPRHRRLILIREPLSTTGHFSVVGQRVCG